MEFICVNGSTVGENAMSEDLKIFEDLKFPAEIFDKTTIVVSYEDSRQEAIKSIKSLMHGEMRDSYGVVEIHKQLTNIHSVNWIKHFFSITGEDLKDE